MQRATIVVALALCASGCASASPFATSSVRGKLQQIEIGMSKDEVLRVVGQPYGREAFPDAGGTPVEFLLYQTKFVGMMLSPGDAELVPVAIKNGRVIGWGRNFYDRTKQYHVEQEVTIR